LAGLKAAIETELSFPNDEPITARDSEKNSERPPPNTPSRFEARSNEGNRKFATCYFFTVRL